MKKLIFGASFIVATLGMYAQNITDGLRYGSSNLSGTARFVGMGGAFGALGGDLSAIGTNPAGSAVFTYSTFGFSLSHDHQKSQTNYFGQQNSQRDSDLAFTQAGGAFVFNTPQGSNWSKFVLSVNYDRTQDFNDTFLASGIGDTSIGNYFEAFAQGVPLDLVELRDGETIGDLYQFLGETEGFGAQQAFLGFQSFIIDPVNPDNVNQTSYVSRIEGDSFDQRFNQVSTGYNGKLSFNGSAQYKDNLYVGVNVNSHFFDYETSTFFREFNTDAASQVTDVRFDNDLRSLGAGISLQAGVIGKIKNLRLGFTYDSPTWYTISEEGSQFVQTTVVDGDNVFTATVNPRVVNVYEDYRLRTPGKLQGSIAYLFGKKGLLSFDYGIRDWSQLRFRPEGDPVFNAENNLIDDLLTTASTYKIGGEYRIKELSLRAGYRFEESPYKEGRTVGDLTGYSLGIGYNLGNTKIGLAWSQSSQERLQPLYNVGLTSTATVDRKDRNIVATVTFGL